MGIPIAADESVRRAEDPLAVAEFSAADLLVVKAQPLGGIRRALRIIEQAGLPVVVSSALDTSVGLAMGAQLAASVPELDYDCGLGTASLLAADVTRDPLVPVDGAIQVRRVHPDPELLDRYAADAERTDWWIERLGRVHAVLEERRRRVGATRRSRPGAAATSRSHRPLDPNPPHVRRDRHERESEGRRGLFRRDAPRPASATRARSRRAPTASRRSPPPRRTRR